MSESKIELKDGTTIKVTGGGKKNNASVSAYTGDYKNKDNHTAIHVNVNTKTGKGSIVEHGEKHSNVKKTDISCYLTTACMKHYLEQFDDQCYELSILRWFRDNFVSKEDIKHYYEIAPKIVASLESLSNCDIVYNEIYENVIAVCVKAIEAEDYSLAYNTYKNTVLNLEEKFVTPVLV